MGTGEIFFPATGNGAGMGGGDGDGDGDYTPRPRPAPLPSLLQTRHGRAKRQGGAVLNCFRPPACVFWVAECGTVRPCRILWPSLRNSAFLLTRLVLDWSGNFPVQDRSRIGPVLGPGDAKIPVFGPGRSGPIQSWTDAHP